MVTFFFYVLMDLLCHCNIYMHPVFIMFPDEAGKFQQLSCSILGEGIFHDHARTSAELLLGHGQ